MPLGDEDGAPAICLALDCEALHLSEKRPVEEDSDVVQTEEEEALVRVKPEPRLRICQRIVSLGPFPSRESCTSLKEVPERPMNSVANVLHYLAVDMLELLITLSS